MAVLDLTASAALFDMDGTLVDPHRDCRDDLAGPLPRARRGCLRAGAVLVGGLEAELAEGLDRVPDLTGVRLTRRRPALGSATVTPGPNGSSTPGSAVPYGGPVPGVPARGRRAPRGPDVPGPRGARNRARAHLLRVTAPGRGAPTRRAQMGGLTDVASVPALLVSEATTKTYLRGNP